MIKSIFDALIKAPAQGSFPDGGRKVRTSKQQEQLFKGIADVYINSHLLDEPPYTGYHCQSTASLATLSATSENVFGALTSSLHNGLRPVSSSKFVAITHFLML